MTRFLGLFALYCLFMFCLSPVFAGKLILSQEGNTQYVIVGPVAAIAAEQFAVDELARVLKQISGAEFVVLKEGELGSDSAKAIFVGFTARAQKEFPGLREVSSDKWFIRSSGEQIILCGGSPRGTLYAVHEFLERELGCRWYDVFNQKIPSIQSISLASFDLQGEPYFQERHIYTQFPDSVADQLFRCRMKDTRPKAAKFGFGYSLGTHTFHSYAKNFPADRPEFRALNRQGERPVSSSGHGPGQICLTEPGAREHVLMQLRQRIADNLQLCALDKDGRRPQRVYAINQNDSHYICQCPACQAISDMESADSAPLLAFINYLADAVRQEHPDILLETWAYSNTIKPPALTRPRDNVMIRVIQLNGEWAIDASGKKNWQGSWYPDLFRPRSHSVNKEALDLLVGWRDIAKHLGIWGYWLSYNNAFPTPYSNLRNIHEELKLYKDCHVRSVFIENEGSVSTSFFSLKNWLGWKLMENPDLALEALLTDFVSGYYGTAAPHIMQYLNFLEDSIAAVPASLGNLSALKEERRGYLSLAFFQRAQSLLDSAEQAVSDDAAASINVRRERIPVDGALYAMWGMMQNQLVPGQSLPWDSTKIRQRYESCRLEQIKAGRAVGGEQKLKEELAKLDRVYEQNLNTHIVPPPGYGLKNLLSNGDFSQGLQAWELNLDDKRFLLPMVERPQGIPGVDMALCFQGEEAKHGHIWQQLNLPRDTKHIRVGGWLKKEGFENNWQVTLKVEFSLADKDGKILTKSFPVATTQYQIPKQDWSFYARDFSFDERVVSAKLILSSGHPGGSAIAMQKPNLGKFYSANLVLESLE